MRHPQVRNVESIEAEEPAPDRPGFRRKRLARAAGGQDIGCSEYTLAPGESAWPYHYHTANEEAIYVLEGTGTIRLADDEISIRSGDYVALPTGESGGHRIRNDGDALLRYLCLSTMVDPDVAHYPDRDMVGIFTGAPPGGETSDDTARRFLRADAEVEYWE